MTRQLVLGIAVTALIAAIVQRERVGAQLREFFGAAGHPLNLAVFRIVFFGTVFLRVDMDSILFFSRLPTELQFPPPGWSAILPHLVINESYAFTAGLVLQGLCVMGMLGLFSRTVALLVALIGLYGFGILQFYGKVSHFHHLWWISVVLAFSPSGAMLSIDALRAAWRRADSGDVAPPQPDVRYALPLRFVWLFMGVIYFFPGFWKLWNVGIRQWVTPDNLRFLLYQKWNELEGWTPWFPVDEYPLLLMGGAAMTLLFELSFIFLVFFATGRILACVMGLFFHNMTFMFMRISFWHLQPMYVSFVDWARFGRWVGRRLFVEESYLVYDGGCGICRRTIASLNVVDVFGRVRYLELQDSEAIAAAGLPLPGEEQLLQDIHYVDGSTVAVGFRAYRRLARRIPLLWPIVPLLYLPPVIWLGERIYRRVADSRTCALAVEPAPDALRRVRQGASPNLAVPFVGGVLVLVNAVCGALQINSWPLAMYPTFARHALPVVDRLTLVVVDAAGHEQELPFEEIFRDQFDRTPTRMTRLFTKTLATRDEALKQARLQALLGHWQAEQGAGMPTRVLFYRSEYSTAAQGATGELIARHMVGEYQPLPQAAATPAAAVP